MGFCLCMLLVCPVKRECYTGDNGSHSYSSRGWYKVCNVEIVSPDNGFFFSIFSDSLAFATEPIVGSLANFLGNQERMPNPSPPEIKVILPREAATFSGLSVL